VIPAGLLDAFADGCPHSGPMSSVHHVCDWMVQHSRQDPLATWSLRKAYVFGGQIQRRKARLHWHGELLLSRKLELIRPSWGLMDGGPSLPGELLVEGSPGSYELEWPTGAAKRPPGTTRVHPRRLRGTHYLIGNAHPHFGHFLLEGLSRLWGIAELSPEERETVSFLVYEPRLEGWMYELLALAGVDRNRIVHASSVDVVDRLVTADPAMRTHNGITTAMAGTWRSMAERVEAGPAERRIYLSRSHNPNRGLRNEVEVEELFRARGFEIVAPETMSIPDQVRLAREAAVLAGPVGSQMYLAAFQRPAARTLVMAPSNFYLKDDVLIASAMGHDLDVVIGGDIDLSTRKRSWAWSVDTRDVVVALDRALGSGQEVT
jgi:hypothetical protein